VNKKKRDLNWNSFKEEWIQTVWFFSHKKHQKYLFAIFNNVTLN